MSKMFGFEYSDLQHFNGGVGYRFLFPNGYIASVVKNSFSYGNEADQWELAVAVPDIDDPTDIALVYDTPIADDVVGWLDDEDVTELLDKVRDLSPRV